MRVGDKKMTKSCSRPTKDLLSDLADELLVSILSLLPTVEAVATSVLSQRWRNLWKHIQNIDIHAQTLFAIADVDRRGVVRSLAEADSDRINSDGVKLLSSFCSSKVFKFDIALPFIETIKAGAGDACVEFALHHHVEDLKLLDLTSKYRGFRCYSCWYRSRRLPDKVFNISSLVKLNLSGCNIKLPPSVSLPLLKTLVLEYCTSITSEEADELISNCPSLESLHIEGFWTSGVHIRHPKLRSVYVDFFCQVRFNTPALELLEMGDTLLYGGAIIEKGHVFEDISSLVKCVFYTNSANSWPLTRNLPSALWKMLANLHHVKILHLSKKFIEYLPTWPPDQPIILECTHVILEVGYNLALHALAVILASCPQIEKLTLIVKENYKHFVAAQTFTPLSKCFRMMNQLKEVEIQYGNFDDPLKVEINAIRNTFMQWIEQVKLVLDNSFYLKTLTIRLDESLDYAPTHLKDQLVAGLENIRNCARYSPSKTAIILHYS